MTVSEIAVRMIQKADGSTHDINHFLKVYAYAKTIGECEHLSAKQQFTLEVTALLHDIACPLCREKYGDCSGAHQELESDALIRAFFQDGELSPDILERVAFLVSHHHTYTDVDGIDHQILLEADYLVNADEGKLSKDAIRQAMEGWFSTPTGIALLRSIYKIA